MGRRIAFYRSGALNYLSNMGDSEKKFELRFEGPIDDSAETLRRLKGALVGDLEFSVEEVKKFLSEAPLTIRRSDSLEELEVISKTLQNAGGKVLLVAPISTSSADTEESFEFSIEDEEPAAVEKTPRTYSLDFNPDQDDPIQDLLKLCSEEQTAADSPEIPAEPPSKTEVPNPPSSEVNLSSLSLEDVSAQPQSAPAVPEKETQAPNAPASTPAPSSSSGSWNFSLSLEEPSTPQEVKTAVEAPIKTEPVAATPVHSQSIRRKTPEDEEVDLDLTIGLDADPLATPVSELKQELSKLEHPVETTPKANVRSTGSIPLAEQIKSKNLKPITPKSGAHPAPHHEEVNQEPGPSKHTHITKDFLLPIVAGSLILGFANFIYFDPKGDQVDVDLLTKLANKTAPKLEGAHKKAQAKEKAKETLNEYHLKSELGVISWSFESKDQAISDLSISILTEKPTELSAEQVARNEESAPWLRKVTVSVHQIKPDAKGKFELDAEARFYVEHHQRAYRQIGTGHLSGSLQEKNLSFSLEAGSRLEKFDPSLGNLNIVEEQRGRYKIYLKAGSISSQPDNPQKN